MEIASYEVGYDARDRKKSSYRGGGSKFGRGKNPIRRFIDLTRHVELERLLSSQLSSIYRTQTEKTLRKKCVRHFVVDPITHWTELAKREFLTIECYTTQTPPDLFLFSQTLTFHIPYLSPTMYLRNYSWRITKWLSSFSKKPLLLHVQNAIELKLNQPQAFWKSINVKYTLDDCISLIVIILWSLHNMSFLSDTSTIFITILLCKYCCTHTFNPDSTHILYAILNYSGINFLLNSISLSVMNLSCYQSLSKYDFLNSTVQRYIYVRLSWWNGFGKYIKVAFVNENFWWWHVSYWFSYFPV